MPDLDLVTTEGPVGVSELLHDVLTTWFGT